jgi:large subunit ribosomal protein L24
MAQKIRKGDTVLLMKGRDRGKQGRVQRLLVKEGRVVVEGVNMAVRHVRPRPGVSQAGRVSIEASIHLANVRVLCPHCNKPARVGFSLLEEGKKVRVCKRCHEAIE